ncbi:hypothetical protein LY90DRAFT_4504 [Neocallimastix californiae]|jgi:hypothetical protein|uniref:Ankyrin n=1 Tax=Neocallimastix californiae TaxID=1754190 RepID=A0A1Y2FFY3_9FUNG|nr:hypothetical protein LY90DRAFT_4504 [Neocallimastix californiae]|eukprot:ORY81725.1 hypothetical protein LY90DRAFT_4504 [Neocallimastix californiae]
MWNFLLKIKKEKLQMNLLIMIKFIIIIVNNHIVYVPFKSDCKHYIGEENVYKTYEFSLQSKWNELFNLKDYKRNHKTLMHFLCEGDRLSAIQFLIEHGAKINNHPEGSSAIINSIIVNDLEPFRYLFISYNNLYYPAGFHIEYQINKIIHKYYMGGLNEQYIYKETEQIAEYLYNHGSDITLSEQYENNFNIVTKIIYKLLKKQKNQEESKNEDQDKKGKSNLSMSESETSEL